MSNSILPGYAIAESKARAFYDRYERKDEMQHQTHYCPGCGHGNISKMLAKAIDQLGIQNRTILISPVGCSVFGYYYFDVGNIQAAHGRAPAVATAAKRSRPDSIVISYQGDGDLAAIGSAEILHAANRGENISVIFVNNAIYSMTGGQVAPTTLVGQKTTTSPLGRSVANEGFSLRVSELLATLDAPVYIERVGLGDNKQLAQASRAIHRAVENQVKGLGFSLIEVLSPCPTIWKMTPTDAQAWVSDVMEKTYPLGVICDRTGRAKPHPAAKPSPSLEDIPGILGMDNAEEPARIAAESVNLQIRIAGFGGQGVLLLGELLAEAGLVSGLEVSWLPSYGPEMRSGTSNCHVRISSEPVDSPLVAEPNVLIAMNEPSLRKFATHHQPGAWVLYNGDAPPEGFHLEGACIIALPFTQIADGLGDPRAGNMVALGALLEITRQLPEQSVDTALRRLVRSQRWIELDRRAIEQGRQLYRNSIGE